MAWGLPYLLAGLVLLAVYGVPVARDIGRGFPGDGPAGPEDDE